MVWSDILKGSFTLFGLYCLLFADGQTNSTNEVIQKETVCFETVTHYYSNPDIAGTSVLQYTYHDNFKSKVLTLSCEDEEDAEKDLYIEVISVTLSLPLKGQDDQYCAESQKTSYERCNEGEQCNCCEKPDETCTFKLDIGQYSSCNRAKSCNLTVSSQSLSDCPARQYECEGKKCHSRWVDVTYICHPVNIIPATTPRHATKGGQPWWIILILAAIIIIIVVAVLLYRKYMKSADQKPSGEKKNEEVQLNPGREYENLQHQEDKHTSSPGETYTTLLGPEYENLKDQQRPNPISGTEYENLQHHTRNNPNLPAVANTTLPSGTEYERLQHQESNNPQYVSEEYETFEQHQRNNSTPQGDMYLKVY